MLILGGIAFTDYSPPESMMAGGKQAMVVHKLPGGSRVIDTLGPDDADITWRGIFWGDNAYATAQTLDAMRAAGLVLPLTWGGQFYLVVIANFVYHVRRIPVWVEYDITCTVAQNPQEGILGAVASTLDTLVSADLGAATATAIASPLAASGVSFPSGSLG